MSSRADSTREPRSNAPSSRTGSAQTGSALGSRQSGMATRGEGAGGDRKVCAFWLGSAFFALDTSIVSELVSVESITPVPLSPRPVLGLFNLRGVPVTLLELADVLGLPSARSRPEVRSALVLREGSLLVGVPIDRLESVLSLSSGRYSPRGADSGNAAVAGFLELDGKQGVVVTVLDPSVLLSRIEELKFK